MEPEHDTQGVTPWLWLRGFSDIKGFAHIRAFSVSSVAKVCRAGMAESLPRRGWLNRFWRNDRERLRPFHPYKRKRLIKAKLI